MSWFRGENRGWQDDFRVRLEEWEGAFAEDSESAFFEGCREAGFPEMQVESFDPSLVWWLAEFCRLSYTPDHVERKRDRRKILPNRNRILEERTPLREIHSVHKTGNHASIYRFRDERPGTIVCFRGSSKLRQWIMNALIRPHGWERFRREGETDAGFVHSGFYLLLKRIWPLLLGPLEEQPRPWIYTGHSLGGALASLAGFLTEPDLICTFGAPKFGNEWFHSLRREANIWRIVNHIDVVPRLPLPDPRQGHRVLSHGIEPFVLDSEGRWISSFDRKEEDRLPFSRTALHREFSRPPEWLTSHRMTEYCRKLKEQVEPKSPGAG